MIVVCVGRCSRMELMGSVLVVTDVWVVVNVLAAVPDVQVQVVEAGFGNVAERDHGNYRDHSWWRHVENRPTTRALSRHWDRL